MDTAIAKRDNGNGQIALTPGDKMVLTTEQIDLIKQQICTKGSDAELQLFLYQCKRTGLDPLNRQIYALFYHNNKTQRDEMSIHISIDGMRLIAERSGKYAGQLGPYWCGPDGKWFEVWLFNGPPAAAKVGILRKDWSQPLWAIARFNDYAKKNKFWNEIGPHMIAIRAEMIGLRKAFPQDLSGLYGEGEIVEYEPAVDIRRIEQVKPSTGERHVFEGPDGADAFFYEALPKSEAPPEPEKPKKNGAVSKMWVVLGEVFATAKKNMPPEDYELLTRCFIAEVLHLRIDRDEKGKPHVGSIKTYEANKVVEALSDADKIAELRPKVDERFRQEKECQEFIAHSAPASDNERLPSAADRGAGIV